MCVNAYTAVCLHAKTTHRKAVAKQAAALRSCCSVTGMHRCEHTKGRAQVCSGVNTQRGGRGGNVVPEAVVS